MISLGQALPFYPPPASALRAAEAALRRPDVHAYTTDPGRPSLRRVLAERLREHARIDCGPDDLLITAGANHAFTTTLTTLVSAGDEVVLPAPYFTNHQMAVQAAGAVPIEAPVADRESYSVTWADIAPALTERTRAVVLCNPSNPTGAPVRASDGARIVAELATRDILVISDETYMHFVYGDSHWSAASVAGWRRNVVVIGTFSKSFAMMGWRVGFMLADAAVCAQATKVQDAMIICAPTISQIAAEAAVRDDWDYPRTFHGDLLERRATPVGRPDAQHGGVVDADARRIFRVHSNRRLHRFERARAPAPRRGARRHHSWIVVRAQRGGLPAPFLRFGRCRCPDGGR